MAQLAPDVTAVADDIARAVAEDARWMALLAAVEHRLARDALARDSLVPLRVDLDGLVLTCQHAGCGAVAVYGRPESVPAFCSAHLPAGGGDAYVDKRGVCQQPGCSKRAHYGSAPRLPARWCRSCALRADRPAGARPPVRTLLVCAYPNCLYAAAYGTARGGATMCVAHKDALHRHVKNTTGRCLHSRCPRSATVKTAGARSPLFCALHSPRRY